MEQQLVVLVSGSGTNLQRIIDAISSEELKNCRISAVIADRNCFAIERALDNEIPTFFVERGENFEQQLVELIPKPVDLIVLAGFLSILPEQICLEFSRKIINVHPSLLPKYGGMGMYGKKVHQAVLENKEKESGATVHFVSKEVDEGDIICQEKIAIKPNESVEWLAAKVHQVEYKILIKSIKKVLFGEEKN